jgi:hypothetical protein
VTNSSHRERGHQGVTGQRDCRRRGRTCRVDDRPNYGCREQPGTELHDPIRHGFTQPNPAPNQRGQRHSGVVVPTGLVSAGIDHRDQHRADTQKRQRAAAFHRCADDEDQ